MQKSLSITEQASTFLARRLQQMDKLFSPSTIISNKIAQHRNNNFSFNNPARLRDHSDNTKRQNHSNKTGEVLIFDLKNHKYSFGLAEVEAKW